MSFLEWVQIHFNKGTDHYIVKPDALGADDKEAFEKLCQYVNSFIPAECVDKGGKFVLSDNGEKVLYARLINTKAILECQSVGEAMQLLGSELVYSLFVYFFLSYADPFSFSFLCRSHAESSRAHVEVGKD